MNRKKITAILCAVLAALFYAISPFIGAFLSFVILNEALTPNYLFAFFIMIVGSILVVVDTLIRNHSHLHSHTFMHTHDGSTHSHTIEHTHMHFGMNEKHTHQHELKLNFQFQTDKAHNMH